MAELFNTIQDIKDFVGGGANVSVSIESLEPVIYSTARKHITDWISQAQYDDLVTAFAGTPDADQQNLLPYVQRALSLLALYEYSFIGAIQFSESGMHRHVTDHMQSAYKYQETNYREWMLEMGYESKEILIKFLDANSAIYTIYAESAAFKKNRSLFINYASDFRNVYSLYLSRYTFETLWPLMEDIECFAILPVLGQTLFDEIKTAIEDDTLTEDQEKLVLHIQRVVANFTIEEAIKRHLVKIQGRRVVQIEQTDDDARHQVLIGKDSAISIKLRHQEEWANRHLHKLQCFLEDNAETFPNYTTLEEQEEAEETVELPPCDSRDTLTADYFPCPGRRDSDSIVNF